MSIRLKDAPIGLNELNAGRVPALQRASSALLRRGRWPSAHLSRRELLQICSACSGPAHPTQPPVKNGRLHLTRPGHSNCRQQRTRFAVQTYLLAMPLIKHARHAGRVGKGRQRRRDPAVGAAAAGFRLRRSSGFGGQESLTYVTSRRIRRRGEVYWRRGNRTSLSLQQGVM